MRSGLQIISVRGNEERSLLKSFSQLSLMVPPNQGQHEQKYFFYRTADLLSDH